MWWEHDHGERQSMDSAVGDVSLQSSACAFHPYGLQQLGGILELVVFLIDFGDILMLM